MTPSAPAHVSVRVGGGCPRRLLPAHSACRCRHCRSQNDQPHDRSTMASATSVEAPLRTSR